MDWQPAPDGLRQILQLLKVTVIILTIMMTITTTVLIMISSGPLPGVSES